MAALGAAAVAPVVVAAIQARGMVFPATLGQAAAFSVGYFTNLVTDWLRDHPGEDGTDLDTVLRALAEILETRSGDEEATRHLTILLADPVLVEAILTSAKATWSSLRNDLEGLLDRQPPESGQPMLVEIGATADDWLLDEVVEILEDLARRPTDLEQALVRVYLRLADDGRWPYRR